MRNGQPSECVKKEFHIVNEKVRESVNARMRNFGKSIF